MRNENWFHKKWRPAMGWMYMSVCITDFILFPILWSLLQAYSHGQVTNQWNPLTIQGAGLFHVAMGAVLGITAWSRGQEKMTNINLPTSSMPVNYNTPYNYGNYNNPYMQPINQRTIITGYGGKKAPPPIYEPEI